MDSLTVRNAVYQALDDVPHSLPFETRRALIDAIATRLEKLYCDHE